MNGATLLETWLSAGTSIDSLWSMYIVVHLGLFWFFFLVHRPLLIIERGLAIFAYTAFAYINGNALITAYVFYEAIRQDIVSKFSRELAAAPETLSVLNGASYAGHDQIIWMTHLGGLILVSTLFLLRNVMIRRYYKLYPEQEGKYGVMD
jgi:hypothetical protein